MRVLSIAGATAGDIVEANRLLAANDAPAFRVLLAEIDEPYPTPADVAYLAARAEVRRYAA